MQWHPTPVLLPGKSHGQRSLLGCSPWGCKESDSTSWLHFHFSLSCIGEGNGNPLQCSCLENPRDGGAWWAAVYGVAQSRTWLKWLSSSSVFMNTQFINGFPRGIVVENLPANTGDIRDGFDLWVKKIPWRRDSLAWKIPWTEEYGGLQSMWPQRVEHDWEDIHTHTHTHTHYHIYASSSKLIYKFHTPAYFVDLHKLILKLMEVKEPRVAQNSIFKGWTPGLWGILETLMGVREREWSKRSELFS